MKPARDNKTARTSSPHRRKDRVRSCGGVLGREHEPEIRLDKTIESRRKTDPLRRDTRCRWTQWGVGGQLVTAELHWSCGHQWVCKVCDRVLRFRVDRSACPDWKPRPAGPTSRLMCHCGHRLLHHAELGGCSSCSCKRFVLTKDGK